MSLRRFLLLSCLLALAVLALPAATPAAQRGPCVVGTSGGPTCHVWIGKVAWVDDGDTVHVKVGSRMQHVRITGIQAMELTNYNSRHRTGQCHAVEATERLEQLIKRSKGRVRLAAQDMRSVSGHRPRRSVAVWQRGRWVDVGRTLLREGLVLWLPNNVEWAWNARYGVYVEQAQAARVGLWNTSSCGIGPNEGAPLKVWVNWKVDSSLAGDPNGEWVKVRNLDPVNALPLDGWWLRDSGLREYRFPAGAAIPPGGVATLSVGSGFGDATTFYWNEKAPVFGDVNRATEMGDGAYLFDPQGDLRAWMTYPCRTTCGDPNRGALELVVKPRGQEWVGVRNVSGGAIGLEGYRLTIAGHVYAFDHTAVLQPGQLLRVYTTRDSDRDAPLVKGWGQPWTILGDKGGAVELSTFTDSVLACAAWGTGKCGR